MVKLTSDSSIRRVEELQKARKAKEKELHDIEAKKEKELKDVDKKLEEAVADVMTSEEKTKIEEPRIREIPEEEVNLEEQVMQAPHREVEGEGGPAYDVIEQNIAQIGDLYGQVKQELQQGHTESDVVKQAQEAVYQAQQRDYLSSEEREGVDRMNSLLDMFEARTGQNIYK